MEQGKAIDELASVFLATKGREKMTTTSGRPHEVIRADHVPGPRQGEWTYSHYVALPDDGQRYEIVDGVLYMAPAPDRFHQVTANLIATYLTVHIKFTHRGEVLAAPFDVKLSFNTVVQPDVLVYLKKGEEKIMESRIGGVPDLVVEVASPSTARYDRREKYHAYARAGVREYWIVDPRKCNVEVLELEDGEYRSMGIFSGDQTLQSTVIPDFPVQVKQVFDYE